MHVLADYVACKWRYSLFATLIVKIEGVNVQIQRTDGLWYWAEYSTFSISDEAGKYMLTADGYSGDAGDALVHADRAAWVASGKPFSTYDNDNDEAGVNCANTHSSGWWFGQCSTNVLNVDVHAIWVTDSPQYDVQHSRMLLKLD